MRKAANHEIAGGQAKTPDLGEDPVATRRFAINLFLIGLSGVALTGWILYYTDYFEIFSGLLSLTGILTWVAMISKVLPESRLKDMQHALDSNIMSSRKTVFWIVPVFLLGIVAVNFCGAVQVEALQDVGDHALWVHRSDSVAGEPDRLTAGGRLRSLVWTSLWSPSTIRVKVSGYPDLQTQVHSRERLRLYTPGSFLRPVVLIKPSVDLINFARNNRMSMLITMEKEQRRLEFDGHAVWIGCDEDVQLPAQSQDLFRAELGASENANVLQYWLYPIQLGGGRLEPHPGNHVEVKLFQQTGVVYTSAAFPVRSLQRRQDFPQVEVLDVPR